MTSRPSTEPGGVESPTLIDRYLPEYDVTTVRRKVVDADPETTYEAALDLDLLDLGPAVRALGWLRDVPRRVAGRVRGAAPTSDPETLRFADVGETDEWMLLEEVPGEAFLAGAVGKFWRPTIEWRQVDPAAFAGFDEPGYGKLALSLSVRPLDDGRTLLVYEARTATTDDRSRRAFRWYWRVIGPFAGYLMSRALDRIEADAEAAARRKERPSKASEASRRPGLLLAVAALALAGLYHLVIRPWHRRWGTIGDEATRWLPGDDRLTDPAEQVTHAVEIDAPPEDVWPWLVQIGQDRGGFYSYDWLERLVGADVHNADRVVPTYQDLSPGDVVRLAPADHPFATPESAPAVVRLDDERALVLEPPGEPPAWTWAFVLEPTGEGRTRLLSRMRSNPSRSTIGPFAGRPGLRSVIDYCFWDPAHFVMDRKLLLGIRGRVEGSPAVVPEP